jgi:hypothetical protein
MPISPGAFILCATSPAETVYLENMGHHLSPDLIVDLILKPLNGADIKVHDLAAGEADKMVVVIAVRA